MIEAIQKIIGLFEDKKVAFGEYVFKEGETDPNFYIIISGKVEISQTTNTGEIKSVGVINRGEFFGEGSLSRDAANLVRPANAFALMDTRLLVLPREKFDQLMEKDPMTAALFLHKILEVTYERLRVSNAELLTLFEVGKLIGAYLDDFNVLAQKILEQVLQVTKSKEALMIIRNKMTNQDEVVAQIGNLLKFDYNFLKGKRGDFINKAEEATRFGLDGRKALFAQIPDLGVILLTRGSDERDFTEPHLMLLQSVAEQAKTAIERAWKIKEEKAKEIYNRRKNQFTF